MADFYDMLSDETLRRIADGGDPYESMTDEELQRVADMDKAPSAPAEQTDGYGFSDRQSDQLKAQRGSWANDGMETAQAVTEGVAPFQRQIQGERAMEGRENLAGFLGEGPALQDALDQFGDAPDPSLRGYKAEQIGATEGFVRGVGHELSAQAANLPFGIGSAVKGVRGLARRGYNKYATDVLIDWARDTHQFDDEDIEKAKEASQGDPLKMYDFFSKAAQNIMSLDVEERGKAQARLAEHKDDEGFVSKVAGGALGMIPMLEEFAMVGGAGKALGIGGKVAANTWRGRVAEGMLHSAWMTPTMGSEMARRRYGELTADEYGEDEQGNLVKIEGDDAGTALKKAIPGGLGEAAIFSLPIGEAALGWATPMITKGLRTKVGQSAARMYENYVKYGQITGLRGQPQMLALMDLNAFKDEVLGLGVKDADYEGFGKAWDRFANETLTAKSQLDMFVSTLGVVAAQGGAALAKARIAMGRERRSTDSVLHTYYGVPKETLDRMAPEQKAMWRQLIMDRSRGAEGGFSLTEEKLRKFCDRMDKKFGLAANDTWEKMGKYALEFDNSNGWENVGDASAFQSKFKVPFALQADKGNDGKLITRRVVPWQEAEVPLPDGTVTKGHVFTDPNTGISVMKYQPIDAAKGDNGWIYLVGDGEGRRATRMGFRDAFEAANEMSRKSQLNRSQNAAKKNVLAKMYGEMFPGESPLAVDSSAQAANVLGRELDPGEVAFADKNGKQYYVLDRIQTPEQMKKVVLHEAGRHRGIDLALPNPTDKMGFLIGLARSGDPVIQSHLNRIAERRMAIGEINSPEELFKRDKDGNFVNPHAANALEEVWAHLFDHEGVPSETGWWDAHMNAIRGNLRKVFHGLSYSRAEAEEMYRGAMDKLAQQTGGAIEYVPEPTERDRMVLDEVVRDVNQRAGRAAEREISEVVGQEERDLRDMRRADAKAERKAQHEARLRGIAEADAAHRKELENIRQAVVQGRITEAEAEERRKRIEEMRARARENERIDHEQRLAAAEEANDIEAVKAEEERWAEANRAVEEGREQEYFEQNQGRREEEKAKAAEEAEVAEAESVRAAQEREKQAQEREAQRVAGYEAADEQARLDRKNAVKQALREDDARRGEEYDRAEAERMRREAEDEANGLPRITVEEPEPTKTRTAPQGDVVRVNYGAGDGREGHQIVARRVTDGSGNVIGWDVNAVAKDGTETLIASTTKQKKNGEAAIRAVRKQIHDHFGLPYGKDAEKAMDAERARLDEKDKKEAKDETGNVRDEEPAKPEQGAERRLPAEGEEARPAEEGEADGEEVPVVVRHANEGRSGDLMQAGDDALAGLFGDEPAETPVEAPVSAPREEGTTSRPTRAEGAGGGNRAPGGDSVDDAISFLRNLPPDFKFFDEREELMDDTRRDGNQRLVNLIGNLYDKKKVRGFNGFARMVKSENPTLWAEQKNRLPALWNYAAQLSEGKIPRVGDYEARDAIKGVDEGRNVRDVRGINALEAALQDIDVEMYPAAKLDRSDARVPNTKLAADPKSGIVPGHELKGRPRSLLSKPILGVEFEDGTVSVGTGRHRAELYSRYGMDIPMRRVREADGWVAKKPDGTYDFTKIRLLDALDNIQDSKGTIEDYVAFFRDVKIPRSEAESEGFLGSKEARTAYALANDAINDVRAAANFDGGRRAGYVSPEQAGAIADAAPKGAWEHNETVQRQLLKDVLKDRSMDATDIAVDAGLIAEDIRREINAGKVFQADLFGNVIDAGAELREKKRDYIRDQISRYERLAKDIRAAKNSENGLTIKRADMRALGINEREIAKGGADMRREYEKAAQKAALRAMEWRTGITSQLNPEDRAQMEKDLGIETTEPKERQGQQSQMAIPSGLDLSFSRKDKALSDIHLREKDGKLFLEPYYGEIDTSKMLDFRDLADFIADRSGYTHGGKAWSDKVGEAIVKLREALGDNWRPNERAVKLMDREFWKWADERKLPRNDASRRKYDESISQTLMDLGGEEGGDLFNGTASRFFNVEEELTPDRNKDYAEWLGKYKLADGPERRREWARKNPEKATPEALERAAFDARQYSPAKYKVPGAVKSRTLLEEPPALRATEPPDNDYKLHIPESIIKNGELQEHQAEFVGYAGKAHENVQPNGTRLGMMGGYGTGAGKSRMIAGIILDNRNQGRKRALWITTQSGLVDDVRSESKPFGMDGMVYEMFGGKGVTVPKDGIGFGTYHGLRQEGVVEEIAKQLGKDFDGVIAFDEIHRAKTEGGNTQNAVVKLQELLPKARVVYMSATGATDVGNLGYGQRLGLWGEGTAFKDFEDFKKKVEGKGVSAMEMVAQTLKRRGQYLSANLSKEGVEFDHVSVPTTEAQKKTYAEYNGALKDVYKGVYDALEAMGRLDYTVPPSSLHGMQQRLHYSMVTALKVPVLIERAKQELAKGNAPVFSLVNTNEAGATREIAKALERGEKLEMDDVNFGPKQILLDFLTKEDEKSYQGNKDAYKDYQFPTMKPVKDGSGEVIGFERDQVADGIRRRLVREVEALPDDFGNPINMIIDAFGKDNVANLTGLNRGGMAEDYKAFQDGDKKVLVFSGVANTGYTFSSDRKYKNQARRVAFPLQLGYRADELEQTLGRVHRNNQANAPIYIASTTDLPGERRFYSSVERRRGQMKALTTGDRSAGGNGITSEGDNFETKYAQQAVDAIIATLHRMGKLDDIAREMNFIKRTQMRDGSVVEVNGMLKKDKSGAVLPNVPAKRFLNRLLMLDPKKQDGMFTAFKNYLDQIVQWAKDDGEYDIGLQDIGSTHNDPVRSVKLADDMDVEHVNSWFKTDKQTFDDFAKAHAAEFMSYVRNKRTGETFAVRADGKMGKKQEPAAMRFAVDGTKRRMKASILDTDKPNAAYERLDPARAKELWDAEYGVIPDERADDGFYARGDLLRHWADVLGSKPPRTFRVKAGDAPEYIGARITPDEIPAIFGRFGKAEEARDMVIDGKVREVLNNRTVDLVNGWTLKQVPRDGAKKVMVRGVEPGQLEAVAKELGGEVSKKRIFMKPDAAKLRKIIEEHPANLYRDDEKIGDTGNLRFFNEREEMSDREREEMNRRWMEGTRDIPVGDKRKHPGIFGDEAKVDKAKADYDALPKVYELPSKADLTDAEADAAFKRHVGSIRERDKALAEWSASAPDVLPFVDADNGAVSLVSKDTKEPGRWRVSSFVNNDGGMMITGHSTFDTKAEAVKDATSFGREYDPSVRFFNEAEESRADRDAAYREWLDKYRLADNERNRREWDARHPADDLYSVSENGQRSRVGRNTQYGVGKDMMGKVYFHKNYAEDVVPKSLLEQAKAIAEERGFDYNTMMYDPKSRVVRLDESPDFDTAREPHPGRQLRINPDGTAKELPYQRQIFHHKWAWVKDDYDGFDVQESKDWSRRWLSANEGKGSPSGWMEKWNEKLDELGLPRDGAEEAPALSQRHTSKDTSLPNNKPFLYNDGESWTNAKGEVVGKRSPLYDYIREGGENLDIGAGKTPHPTEILAKHGVTNVPFDPFNRGQDVNAEAIRAIQGGKKFDTVTAANLLNVLESPELRENVVLQAAKAVKPDGHALFDVYRAPKEGEVASRPDSWQTGMKPKDYLPEVRKWFNDVRIDGNGVIVASKPKAEAIDAKATWWDANPNKGGNTFRFFNIDEEAGRRVHAKDLDEARRMEGAGAGRREIWEKTGWWKAKDGKWRYEIKGISADETKRMLDFALASGKFYDKDKANVYSFTLSELEKAMKEKGERLPDSVKTLLAAYPKLGTERIEVDRMAKQPQDGTLGYATGGKKGGTIHLYEQGATAETLNHELQHRIQEMSGMAGGTNTDGKSFDRYTHEHGEWEARQAATRARMSDEDRGKTAPWETSDRHGVAEDATQIDDANRKRIKPDGEPKEPEPADPAMERKTGIGDKAKTELVDRYDPIKKMEIATGKRGKSDLYVEKSPYNAMRLLHGHNEASRQRYEKIWKRPFEDMLRKSGVTVDDVGMYMIATNAKDRNRKVMDRTGALDGAGLSDADAAKILSDLRSRLGAEKMGRIEEMAKFLWEMQDEGMNRRIESGRVSAETVAKWRQEEPNHVPMRDDLSDEDGEYNRSTRRWTRNDFQEANGRYTLPDNPVEFMFKEYQDAVYGSNINEARRALADFVRSTPGIGKIRRGVRKGKAWSFTHGQIEDFPDPNYREQTVKGGPGRPNLVSFKEGGDLYMIELNGKQGERVAEAVIGRGLVNMWKPVAAFTRGYASTATELSPAFLGRNFVADMIEASLNTMADKGLIKGGASAVKNVVNAVRMARTIRKYITTGRFEGQFADVMRRYVEAGGSIGGMGNEGYTELKNDLGKVSTGKHGVLDVLKFVLRGISNLNKQGELATRLAVFKDYIDGGASDGEAAMRSREYSTDFNKYGNQRWMNSAWMFSGSVIGGAVRQTASLVQGKAGKQLMLGLFAYGVLEGVLEHFYNSDEDEKAKKSGGPSSSTMTEYNRANSLYFRMGSKFIRAPFHAGPFSVLKYAGNVAARAALGDISGADAAKNIGKEALENGMHFTGTGDFNTDTVWQSLAPTLFVPFLQLSSNEDYAGRPIRKQMYSETKPFSENGRKQTGDVWKSMARGMNELTGGNQNRRGWFDFSPENYKFVVDSALKNLGRDITTVSDFVTDLREGKDIDKSHVLFGRDYVRDVPDNTQNFYEAERRYKADRADGTIRAGSRRDEAVKQLIREITTLRHWEDGEEKVGSRWVKKRNPSEATKEKHKRMRLKYQQRVIDLMKKG